MKSKQLIFPETKGYQSSGITIEYIKSRDVLYISGWFDAIVGIEGTEITFGAFCDKLGIDLKRKGRLDTQG